MVDASLALIGIGIGLAMAAPVGPVNIMCLQRAVQKGFWAGVTAGCGAVLGDAIFASVAAFGITAISRFIAGHTTMLQLVSGIILLIFGTYSGRRASRQARIDLTHAREDAAVQPIVHAYQRETILSMLGASLTAFALTITNPATMFGFLTIFSGLGTLGDTHSDYLAAATLVTSVAVGSLLWWVVVSGLVSIWRGKITDRVLVWINRASGYGLAFCGLLILGKLAFWG